MQKIKKTLKYKHLLILLFISVSYLNLFNLSNNFIKLFADPISYPSQVVSSTALTSSTTSPAFNQNVVFTIKVTGSVSPIPTGIITLNDGGNILGTSNLDGSSDASFSISNLSSGNHNIVAYYSGDAKNLSSASNTILINVLQTLAQPNIVLSADNNSVKVGQTVNFVIKVSGSSGIPTGNIDLNDSSNNITNLALDSTGQATYFTSSLSTGVHNILAVYTGDSKYTNLNSNILNLNVTSKLNNTNAALSVDNSSPKLNQSVIFSINVTTDSNGIPTGTITFSEGSTTLGTSNLDNSGNATFTTASLTSGSHIIKAIYSGDTNFSSATSNFLTLTVNSQLLKPNVILTTDNNSILVNQTLTLNISVNLDTSTLNSTLSSSASNHIPTGIITFLENSIVLGTATLNNNGSTSIRLNDLKSGTHNVTASYSGDANFDPGQSVPLSIIINAPKTSSGLSSILIFIGVFLITVAIVGGLIYYFQFYKKNKARKQLIKNLDQEKDNKYENEDEALTNENDDELENDNNENIKLENQEDYNTPTYERKVKAPDDTDLPPLP